MKSARWILLISGIFIFLYGCGQGPEMQKKEPRSELCDGTDDLVLAVRLDVVMLDHNAAPDLFSDNGRSFIYVNGKCKFWAWGVYDDSLFTMQKNRSSVHTGTLSELDIKALRGFLRYDEWPDEGLLEKAATKAEVLITLSSKGSHFKLLSQSSPEGEMDLRDGIVNGFKKAKIFLFEIGSPMTNGKYRVHILPDIGETLVEPSFEMDWSEEVSVGSLVKVQNPYCYGKSYLIEGEHLAAFDKDREDYLKKSEPLFSLMLGVGDDLSKKKHQIKIRNSLPFETENGLIPIRGEFGEFECP